MVFDFYAAFICPYYWTAGNQGEEKKMNKFRIQRVNPTMAVIYQKMVDGSEEPISTPMEYSKCVEFIHEHQKKLKIYKIMEIYHRKNAKRHIRDYLYAEDQNEALQGFDKFLEKQGKDNVNYELCSGDWKLIATRKIGESIIII